MKVSYDKYYQSENLFGKAYPELIALLKALPSRSKLLDLGCGQGRDAIPLARLGYEVTGIDVSKVGIAQMNKIAQNEKLPATGIVADIYAFDNFSDFDVILLDSMFHFTKKDLKKETDFIKRIIQETLEGTIIIFCIQDVGKKITILNEAIDFYGILERVKETDFQYEFNDDENRHVSKTDYKMIVVRK